MNEQAITAFREFGEACQRMADAIIEALRPVYEAVKEFCERAYAWVRDQYRAAGAPYGDSHDGMMRWWDEILTIARIRQQAEMLAEMRL